MTPNPNYKSLKGERLAMAAYQRLLDQWPVPNDQRTVPTRHGEAFVISFGDPANPPLVLLHGSAANSATWGGEAALYARHFRVHAIDLPGETGKSIPNRPPYAGATYPEWLGDVLDRIGVERAAFLGLSLGGWVALRFAASTPERAERVALLAPGGVVKAKTAFMVKAAVYSQLGTWGIQRITAEVFGPGAPPPGAAESFAFGLKHYRARRDTLPPLTEDELRGVVAPVFLIGGKEDALLNMPATRDRLQRLLPNFQSSIIPGAGHALLGVGPEVVAWLTRPVEPAALASGQRIGVG